jgi:phosphoribosylformylglycinamidine synthase subunit PurS
VYLAKITVSTRKSILDPQGRAVGHAFTSLGMPEIVDVRIGKYIELKIDAGSIPAAEGVTDEACRKLLANPVMEDYSFSVEKI